VSGDIIFFPSNIVRQQNRFLGGVFHHLKSKETKPQQHPANTSALFTTMSLFSKKKEKSDTKDKKDKKSSTDKKAPKLSASSKHPSSNDLSLKKANLEQKGINLHVITAN
jgi:hypothetical protein